MKNLFFILLVIFTFYSCASDEVGFKHVSKKVVMESWAWKIFIFTDEGEFTPVEKANNNFDSTTKVNPIFVEDFLEMYRNDDSFLNYQKEVFNDPIVYTNFNLTKRKK